MSTDPVGSLAEEAAKLIAALQGWTQDIRGRDVAEHERPASGAAEQAHDHADHDHADPLSAECRYCPLCNIARFAKATTPEVRDHLVSAGLSLAMAFKELMDNAAPPKNGSTPVEKIDLEDS